MISPQDLIKACEEFPNLEIGYRLKRFDSGAVFIQSENYSDEAVVTQVLNSVSSIKGLSPSEFSVLRKISVILAREQLLVLFLTFLKS